MDLFGTAGIRGSVTETVTPAVAQAVGRAVAVDAGGPTVVLGWDGRESSEGLAAAVEAGVISGGGHVRRIGQVPTPALAYASRDCHGIMITASHNPPTDNGIKCFVDGEEYDSEAEKRVESLVGDDQSPVEWAAWGSRTNGSVLPAYREAVAEYVRSVIGADDDTPLSELRILVDCGNGVSAAATPQVLRSLGATPVTLHANIDGHFPARESKPTPETLTDLRRTIAQDDEADFGIGHDGDSDRIVIVDTDGDVVHEDTILAILAEHYVGESEATAPVVVTTPNASGRIDERVAAAGGTTERVALGVLHEGVVRYDTDEQTVVFAGEPWKHIHTQFGPWIDAVASAAVFAGLVADAGSVKSLREPITERPYRKVSVDCPDNHKEAAMELLEQWLPEQFDGSVDTEYGVRIDQPDGSWLLVRPSGTEPYIRLYAESEAVGSLVDRARGVITEAVEDAK